MHVSEKDQKKKPSDAIDVHWLAQAVELIETLLHNVGGTMSPEAKAQCIVLAYDILVRQGESGRDTVAGFLRLVVSR